MLEFVVYGKPQPQGSKNPFKLPNGRIVLVEASKGLKPWREAVALAALSAMNDRQNVAVSEQPCQLKVHFYFERPKSVKREWMSVKPDLDKLVRGVNDALTGVVFKDDSQVVEIVAQKSYTQGPAMAVISVVNL